MPSLEYQLATINKGFVTDDDVTITRFRYLLDELDSKTTNSKQQIADMSVAAIKILKNKYGIEYNLLNFMEEVNMIIPQGSGLNYAEVATAYVQQLKL